MCSLKRANKCFAVGVYIAFAIFAIGCDSKIRGRLPESTKLTIQMFHRENLEPLRTKGCSRFPKNAELFYEFAGQLDSSARKYSISPEDVVEIMGRPVHCCQVTCEFEYQYPGYPYQQACVLVWFDQYHNVQACFPVERPSEHIASLEAKEGLKNAYRDLLLPLKVGTVDDSTDVDKRLKKMKMAFKDVLKSKTFTYRDVVDIMGPPTGVEESIFVDANLSTVPYGNPYHPRYSLVIGYRFKLNDTTSSVLNFAFFETIGGCLGMVYTSWVGPEEVSLE